MSVLAERYMQTPVRLTQSDAPGARPMVAMNCCEQISGPPPSRMPAAQSRSISSIITVFEIDMIECG